MDTIGTCSKCNKEFPTTELSFFPEYEEAIRNSAKQKIQGLKVDMPETIRGYPAQSNFCNTCLAEILCK
jgi:hypothetical protein